MIARIKGEYKIRPYVRRICRHYDPENITGNYLCLCVPACRQVFQISHFQFQVTKRERIQILTWGFCANFALLR